MTTYRRYSVSRSMEAVASLGDHEDIEAGEPGEGAAAAGEAGSAAHGLGGLRETFAPPRLTPFFTFQQALTAGEHKAELHWAKTVVLGLLAGMYIAIGALLAITIGGGVPGFDTTALDLPGLQKLLFGIVFPVGLLLVSLAGAELVTSSLALVFLALLEGTVTVQGLLKNWTISYLANFAGSLFFLMLALQSEIFLDADELAAAGSNPTWTKFAVDIAYKKAHLSFQDAFTRGFMCNWLVCLAVWNSYGANTIHGKAAAIWPAIMAFVSMGFEHCVANMFLVPLGIVLNQRLHFYPDGTHSDITWGDFFLNNLLPVTFGNLLGATCMVAGMYSLAYGRSGVVVARWWRILKVKVAGYRGL